LSLDDLSNLFVLLLFMKQCLLCKKKCVRKVCHTCHIFLKDRYGKKLDQYIELLEEELGGQKDVGNNLEKTKEKRTGGRRR
jgi:hypothetical protein